MKGNLGSYPQLIRTIQDHGYHFIKFREFDGSDKKVIFRHDIDFSCEFALEMANIEVKEGILSTYFFMLSSKSYNVATPKNLNAIRQIHEMGHDIYLHFDPSCYDDFRKGLYFEADLFKHLFNVDVNLISIHRPNDFFLNHNLPIGNIEHTYQEKYFSKLKYFSDSTGKWRFGSPLDSVEFVQGNSLQVLTHPIWWVGQGKDSQEKLKSHYSQEQQLLTKHFLNNCQTFSEILS